MVSVAPVKYKTDGNGNKHTLEEWKVYRANIYECLFYKDKQWNFDGQSQFFNGSLIHYSDFMKAKRGNL